MYDITYFKSFTSLEAWMDIIKNTLGNRNDYLEILLGNKLDLVNSNKRSREVSEEEALNFCKKYDIFWGGELDALMDNVDDIKYRFKLIVEEIYKKVGNNNKNINESKKIILKEKRKKKKNCVK